MPQGLGGNLSPTLSVFENVDFFGRLFGQTAAERKRRIHELLESTGLRPFLDRPAGKLSGGMKQKLGLCCALIHDPDLLSLDEPTTGVDSLSRRQFWDLVTRIRSERKGMSVLMATAYMDEAAKFDWLVAMDDGKVLTTGTPAELLERGIAPNLEAAFIALQSEEKRCNHQEVDIPTLEKGDGQVAIEAKELTKSFGDFVAVDHVNLRIERGEIFGFLGSNGCGKSTTMKVLTGLLPATSGTAELFGEEIDANDIAIRRRVGYMSQGFSLYSELTVQQNLILHARLFSVPKAEIESRTQILLKDFGLEGVKDALPSDLPLGVRQRLSLAVALVHKPELLILDEPTSGVDPIARDSFWQKLIELSRKDHVTIFISTHFMNEAERCDRISLMHAGRVLVTDTPVGIVEKRKAKTLEEAFVGYLEDASKDQDKGTTGLTAHPATPPLEKAKVLTGSSGFSLQRMLSYTRREVLELIRDRIRTTMALLGSVLQMCAVGFGINFDVEDLPCAVLDRDQTVTSREYALNLVGSRYFVERESLIGYEELDRRMRSGELSVAIELPPGFARDIERGKAVQIGVWIDGSMPARAETVRAYVQGIHAQWQAELARSRLGQRTTIVPATVETRFRYNPEIVSLVAMIPSNIAVVLILFSAMLAALSVVREKELGTIINFYATPVTRLEFLLGKQLAYVSLGMLIFFLLSLCAVTVLQVPLTGSFATLAAGALL